MVVEFLYCFMAHSSSFFIRICVCVLCLLMPLFRQAETEGRASSDVSAAIIMRAQPLAREVSNFGCVRCVIFGRCPASLLNNCAQHTHHNSCLLPHHQLVLYWRKLSHFSHSLAGTTTRSIFFIIILNHSVKQHHIYLMTVKI
jgi:hypothetical protein